MSAKRLIIHAGDVGHGENGVSTQDFGFAIGLIARCIEEAIRSGHGLEITIKKVL